MVLIANDQEWASRSLESILAAEGYQVLLAYTGRQAIDKALSAGPDALILDTQLPDISGPEVCRALRADPCFGWGVPVILTTAGSSGRARQVEIYEAGAWDFAPQPFDGPLLLLKLRTFLRAKAALDSARADAMVDPASGLYNTRGVSVRLVELSQVARRRREPMTCIVLSAGSPEVTEMAQAAEEVGRTVGRALRAVARATDVVGRLSPLDFIVVAPALAQDTAAQVQERFHRSVAASRPDGAPEIPLRTGTVTLEDCDATEEGLLGRILAAVEWPGDPARGAVPVR